jgi:hypothetical protein
VTMRSIPSTDQQFLEWCGYQTKKQSPLEMMRLYVNQLNVESKMIYERQVKERKEQLILATNMADAVPETEPLETTALSEANETSMNNPNPQISPAPNTQNIPNPTPEHSSPSCPESSSPERPPVATSSLVASNCRQN